MAALHHAGIFRNQGEVCPAGSRLFVQRLRYDEFCARYVAAHKEAREVRIGTMWVNCFFIRDPVSPTRSTAPSVRQEAQVKQHTGQPLRAESAGCKSRTFPAEGPGS